jgi:hypothetical protein
VEVSDSEYFGMRRFCEAGGLLRPSSMLIPSLRAETHAYPWFHQQESGFSRQLEEPLEFPPFLEERIEKHDMNIGGNPPNKCCQNFV